MYFSYISDMKRIIIALLLFLPFRVFSQEWKPCDWPVLKHYDQDHLRQISLPIGGIGTGTVGLGGRGELRDWEIANVPGIGFSTTQKGNNAPFFAIYVKEDGQAPKTKMLAGKVQVGEYEEGEGKPCDHHGLPRFAFSSFDAAYPFGQVNLSDDYIPVQVRIKGFNPMVPGDEEISGLPVAILSYEVTNPTDKPLDVAVCGTIRNFIGKDASQYDMDWKGVYIPRINGRNVNVFKQADGVQGICFDTVDVDPENQAWGNMSLVTDAVEGVTYRLYSADNGNNWWTDSLLDFWDDFSDDGLIRNPVPNNRRTVGEDKDPMASLCVKKTLAPGETGNFNFYLTWNFPNRFGWSRTVLGNYYSVKYPDSFRTAADVAAHIAEYEASTLDFVQAFVSSDYPEEIKEAALFNSHVLRSQTTFRIPSGHFLGWEGTQYMAGVCGGTCTHVWNYEVATAFLYGNLARTMREVETEYATHDDGAMAFRVSLPLQKPDPSRSVAADGQLGCVMKFYREWQLSGDSEWLAAHWPAVRSNMAYAWVDWDADQDGVMEGCQHNTMDVAYSGPNPQVGFWYMGALRAAEEMALAMKDREFAKKCHTLFEKGSRWMDANLFNGEYYEHKIMDPQTHEFLPDGDPRTPKYQLGKGCLVDQLVAQYLAHMCGLGYLGDRGHLRTTLGSIMKYNYIPDFSNHFNNMRSFVIGDEAGLVMASWPKGRIEVPFPYFNEVMTGFEYAAAVGMIEEGLEDDGLKCIRSIRERFDGAKRNPFNEAEGGNHYGRSMASWAAVPAYVGFHYSGVDHTMSFASRPGHWFWSNGYAWGTVDISEDDVRLEVLHGSLSLKALSVGDRTFRKKIELSAHQSVDLR